ncbi:hypothetical protein [Hahella ganghwensis]|uniref:phage fiber-tail adaptor protein n=1 Tax=Hahella ganghwensis TaxID=286420 RepID=UPI00035E039C|nr:hypothetical protein [Hahella ganghwensis]
MALLVHDGEKPARVSPAHKDDDDSYGFDWSPKLADGETITGSSWAASSGATIQDGSYQSPITKVWLENPGTLSEVELANTITTSELKPDSNPRTLTRTIIVEIAPI